MIFQNLIFSCLFALAPISNIVQDQQCNVHVVEYKHKNNYYSNYYNLYLSPYDFTNSSNVESTITNLGENGAFGVSGASFLSGTPIVINGSQYSSYTSVYQYSINNDSLGINLYNRDTSYVVTSNWYRSDYIPVKPNTTYYFSNMHSGTGASIYQYDSSKTQLQRDVYNLSNFTYTTTSNCYYLVFDILNAPNYPNIMINEGSRVYPYQSYGYGFKYVSGYTFNEMTITYVDTYSVDNPYYLNSQKLSYKLKYSFATYTQEFIFENVKNYNRFNDNTTYSYNNFVYYNLYNNNSLVGSYPIPSNYNLYFYFNMNMFEGIITLAQDDYQEGYRTGYDEGVITGKADANYTYYNDGYTEGEAYGYQRGYGEGYNEGLSGGESAIIFGGIMDVAFIPVNVFFLMFNYEVFGINVAGFVSGLLTIAIVIIIFKFILGRKV